MLRMNLKPQALLGAFLTAALLTGCPGQPAPKARPDAIPGSQIVDLNTGAAGNLRLGMTADEAQSIMGASETRPTTLLSWRGGKVCAFLEGGRITRLIISDPAFSLGTLHVGNTLPDAKQAYPTGTFSTSKVGIYELPNSGGKYTWLEVSPTVDENILTINLSVNPRPVETEGE